MFNDSMLVSHEWSFGDDKILSEKLKNLEAWREDHRNIFHQLSDTFTDQSLVICEEFKLVEVL
jgi:uncharacterized protein YhfF